MRNLAVRSLVFNLAQHRNRNEFLAKLNHSRTNYICILGLEEKNKSNILI